MIIQHPHVVQYPTTNDCLQFSIGVYYETQLVPRLLSQVSVQELHNSMVIPPEEGGLKEEIDKENNIIISDLDLTSIIPPQLKNVSAWYEVMCGCECCITANIIHSSLLSWWGRYLRKLKDQIQNSQNRRYGEMENLTLDT